MKKFLITENQFEKIMDSAVQNLRVKKANEIQKFIDEEFIPKFNSENDLQIVSCEIIDLLLARYQHDIYLYLKVVYTAKTKQYKEQLKDSFKYVYTSRGIGYFFYDLKMALMEKFNETIGFSGEKSEFELI